MNARFTIYANSIQSNVEHVVRHTHALVESASVVEGTQSATPIKTGYFSSGKDGFDKIY